MSHPDEMLVGVTLALYAIATLLYGVMWARASSTLRYLAPAALGAALAANAYQLVVRWLVSDQPPFKTLYESLLLLAICIAVVYLVLEAVYRARILGFPSALGCLLTLTYAFFQQDKALVNLPPALQSGWFVPHVVVYFFGYASLFVAAAAASIYLLRSRPIDLNRPDLMRGGGIDLQSLLDGAVCFGFCLLTVGLLIGSIWAKAAWGDYWVWDPKETWSLVSWLAFAAYLHLRRNRAWKGRRLAYLVLFGFAAVAFTYLGMQLLPGAEQSAHVYQ